MFKVTSNDIIKYYIILVSRINVLVLVLTLKSYIVNIYNINIFTTKSKIIKYANIQVVYYNLNKYKF